MIILSINRGALALALILSFVSPLSAGEPAAKAPSPVVDTPPRSLWEITVSPYGWLAGVEADMAVQGYSASTSAGFDDILRNLDMTAMLNIEARRGRWGGWLDGLYLKVSSDAETPGQLFDGIDISLESVIAEAALFYRVWDGERGHLDLYAGARYMSMGTELTFDVSETGTREVAEDLSARLFEEIGAALRNRSAPQLDAARSSAAAQARAALTEALTVRAAAVRAKVDEVYAIAEAHPRLVEVLRRSDRLKAAISEAANARIDSGLAALEEEAAIAAAAAREVRQRIALARARAKKRVAKAEKRLADELERAIRQTLPEQISQSADWVDPFIGMRARYDLCDRWYLAAKADVGGFGVGSDLVWQAYAGLGFEFSKSVATEIRYKHFSVDYSGDKGFEADLTMSGAFVSLLIRF